MQKTLPKGHSWCLGTGFKYTPATHTDLAKTFARIRDRKLQEPKREDGGNVCALPKRKKS